MESKYPPVLVHLHSEIDAIFKVDKNNSVEVIESDTLDTIFSNILAVKDEIKVNIHSLLAQSDRNILDRSSLGIKFDSEIDILLRIISEHQYYKSDSLLKQLDSQLSKVKEISNASKSILKIAKILFLLNNLNDYKESCKVIQNLEEEMNIAVNDTPGLLECETWKFLTESAMSMREKLLVDMIASYRTLVVWNKDTRTLQSPYSSHFKNQSKSKQEKDITTLISIYDACLNSKKSSKRVSFINSLCSEIEDIITEIIEVILGGPLLECHCSCSCDCDDTNIESSDKLPSYDNNDSLPLPLPSSFCHTSVNETRTRSEFVIEKNLPNQACTIRSSQSLSLLLESFLQFLSDSIFLSRKPLISLVGLKIWKKISHTLITRVIRNTVPLRSQELIEWYPLKDTLISLQARAHSLNFTSQSTSKLTSFGSNIHLHFAQNVRSYILESARNLCKLPGDVLFQVYSGPWGSTAGHDKYERIEYERMHKITTIFYPPSRVSPRVTSCAVGLAALIHRTLSESVTGPSECFTSMLNTCRDISILFLSLLPVLHSKELEAPQPAVLFFNDCFFLAHHFTSSLTYSDYKGIAYSEDDDTNKSRMACISDITPHLRARGEAVLLTHLRNQRSNLLEYLPDPSITGFSLKLMQDEQNIRSNIRRSLRLLNKLATTWAPLFVSKVALLSLIGDFYSEVIIRIIDTILIENDISLESSLLLHNILMEISQWHEELFSQNPLDKDAFVVSRVKSWPRLQEILLLLMPDQSLVHVEQDFKEGKFTTLTGTELCHLVCSLYEDSELRSSCLFTLEQGM